MESCPLPAQEWPQRVPLKVIGRLGELQPGMIARMIRDLLGPKGLDEGNCSSNCKGAFISYTFWILLPDAESEPPLREAISRLSGYVMQL